jgi:hypothetical protein
VTPPPQPRSDLLSKSFRGEVPLDVRSSNEDWSAYREASAPDGAPNVLIVLYDDARLAAWSPFSDDAYVALEQQFAAAMACD